MGLDGKDHDRSIGQTELGHNRLLDSVGIGLFDADGVKTYDAHSVSRSVLINTGLGIKLMADKAGGAVFALSGTAQVDTLPGSDVGGTETCKNSAGGGFCLVHRQFLLLWFLHLFYNRKMRIST